MINPPGGTVADWLRQHQSDAAASPASAWRERGSRSSPGIAGSLEALTRMMRLWMGGLKAGPQSQLEGELKKDKHQLWNQYGKYFGSKEEAKRAYEQAQQQLKQQKTSAGTR